MRAFGAMFAVAACCVFIVTAAGVSPAMSKGLKIHVHIKSPEHIVRSVSRSVRHTTRSVTRSVTRTTRSVTRTARHATRTVTRDTRRAAGAVRRTADQAARTTERGVVHVADKVGTPVVKVAERTTRTVITAVEHPKQTIEALEKQAQILERYARMDVADLTHGNFSKLMRDTAHQLNAVNAGISQATGISTGVFKVIDAMAGAAFEKAVVEAARNPQAALRSFRRDMRAVAAAARTNAADIASGNMAKLLRDVTKQQNAVMAATIRTEVQLAGLPVPKSVLNAGIAYEQTMNKMLTGQGAAELIEAIAHGKTGTALLIATRDADVLQGNQLINATNSEIHKATGISTGVLNTVEQIAGLLVGDGPGVVASDAAKVVAQKSVQVAERDAVEAGVKAASEAAAKRTADSIATRTTTTGVQRTAERTAETGAERTAETGARQTATQATRQATRDAGETGARLGTREVTSPGAREATEVIPQGIVRQRVEFFEGLSRPGARTAVEDGARTAVRTGAERTAETGARTAVEDAARTGARTAAGDTVKVAGKAGFDDMVKSRLTTAAENAAKESIEKGLHPFAVREAVEAAVKKAGEEVATDTANYARYAALAAKPGGVVNVWKAVGTDAATAGGKAVWAAREAGTAAAMHAGEKAAADYVGRWLTVDGGHLAEVAEKASAETTPTFVAKSLVTYVVKKEAAPALEASLDAVSKNYNNPNPSPNSNSGVATQ